MNINNLPLDLRQMVDVNEIEFITKSKWKTPRQYGNIGLIIGGILTAFSGLLVLGIWVPLLRDGELKLRLDGREVVATLNNLSPAMLSILITSIFFIVGLLILLASLRMRQEKGGYFIGSNRSLVCFLDEKTIINWTQFTGNIKYNNRGKLGTIELEYKEQKTNTLKTEWLEIVGITNFIETKQYILQKLKNYGLSNIDLHQINTIRLRNNVFRGLTGVVFIGGFCLYVTLPMFKNFANTHQNMGEYEYLNTEVISKHFFRGRGRHGVDRYIAKIKFHDKVADVNVLSKRNYDALTDSVGIWHSPKTEDFFFRKAEYKQLNWTSLMDSAKGKELRGGIMFCTPGLIFLLDFILKIIKYWRFKTTKPLILSHPTKK